MKGNKVKATLWWMYCDDHCSCSKGYAKTQPGGCIASIIIIYYYKILHYQINQNFFKNFPTQDDGFIQYMKLWQSVIFICAVIVA